MVCTWNAREFSDTAAFGFEDSLSLRAEPEQTVTDGIGAKGGASAGQGVRPRGGEAGHSGLSPSLRRKLGKRLRKRQRTCLASSRL